MTKSAEDPIPAIANMSSNLPAAITSLSIVIPAFNEERRLSPTLRAVAAFLTRAQLAFAEIIVVDDGSSDATAGIVRSFQNQPPDAKAEIKLLSNPGNRGKGYSVRHGALEARGEWVLITDADLSSPIEELIRLAQAAFSADAPIAIGSRALDPSLIGVHQQPLRELCGRVFNLCMRLITGLPHKDTQCGFKLYRADAAKYVFSRQLIDGFSFDVEDLYLAHRGGFHAVEVPVRWNNAEGTTVSGLSGLLSFADLLRIRRLHAGRQSDPKTSPRQVVG